MKTYFKWLRRVWTGFPESFVAWLFFGMPALVKLNEARDVLSLLICLLVFCGVPLLVMLSVLRDKQIQ